MDVAITEQQNDATDTRDARTPWALHATRATIATILGGVIGAGVSAYAAGTVTSALADPGLAATAAAVVAVTIGAVAGAAVGLWIAFRTDPRRQRRITITTPLIGGPTLFAVLSVGAAHIDPALSLPLAYLPIALITAALIGRWLATHDTRTP